MQNTRIHLGYKECTRCSKVEPYSAHIVYPHKTGGYVQPVDKDTKKHLQTLDRRAVKVGRKTKGGARKINNNAEARTASGHRWRHARLFCVAAAHGRQRFFCVAAAPAPAAAAHGRLR